MTQNEWDLHEFSREYAIALSRDTRENFVKRNALFIQHFDDVAAPQDLNRKITGKTKNKTIVQIQRSHWELLEFQWDSQTTCHLLKNISNEMEVLQKLKEKLKELTDTNSLYSELLTEELPIGLMVMDAQCNVTFANTTLKRFFHIPSKARLPKCYNYVKELKPCEDCILKAHQNKKKGLKKTYPVGDRFITAELHPLGDKFIKTFRDTTKEIKLIHRIKEQQDILEKANAMIAEQNDILKRLSNVNLRIGQLKNLDAVMGIAVDSIIETFESHKGAILLFNRAGQIESAQFTGTIPLEERNRIIKTIGAGNIGVELKRDFPGYDIIDVHDAQQVRGKLFLFQPAKTVDPSILELFLMQVHNYLENLKLQRKLEALAQTDSLTGVFNRYYFDKQFKQEQELAGRFGQPLSLIVIDVNGLKEANDTIGHEAGDALLKETANLINENISDYDSTYRVGGDEFIVLLSNCPENQLNIMVEMFREMQTVSTVETNGRTLPIRFSLGGACSTEVPLFKLKEVADKRMYEDKERYYENHTKYR